MASADTSRSVSLSMTARERGPATLTAAYAPDTFMTRTSRRQSASHHSIHWSIAVVPPVVVVTKNSSSPRRAMVPSSRIVPWSFSMAP